MMENTLIKNLGDAKQWQRLVMVGLFFLILYPVALIVGLLAVVQAILSLTTGSGHAKLSGLGNEIANYVRSILLFVSYDSEEKPFPFAPWMHSTRGEDGSEDNVEIIEGTFAGASDDDQSQNAERQGETQQDIGAQDARDVEEAQVQSSDIERNKKSSEQNEITDPA